MKCINCNSDIISKNGNSEVILTCPNCGWQAATTVIAEIMNDSTNYSISIEKKEQTDLDEIKWLSNLVKINVLESRKLLLNGGLLFEGQAIEIDKIRVALKERQIEFFIEPEYKY